MYTVQLCRYCLGEPQLPTLNAAWVKYWRQRLRLKPHELATQARISPTYVSLIEKGVHQVSADVAARLVECIITDPGYSQLAPLPDVPAESHLTPEVQEMLRHIRSFKD